MLKNSVLLFMSLVFYAFGGIRYLFLMLAVMAVNWFGAFFCANAKSAGSKGKIRLIPVIVFDLLILFFFKYFNLFTPADFPKIILPIGISFYLFQAMSYVIDCYRGTVPVQRNFLKFALYISFFPQLIAGPIVQYRDIEHQIGARSENAETFAEGIRRFCFGLGKKVLIANTLGEVVDSVWKLEVGNLGAVVSWVTAIIYSFQIYYDFSGYSDMAIGLGKMFGFSFRENFRYPYLATSIREFWRRWHISLSSWFRDYVYIPLGGSRVSTAKLYRNIMIVFLLTGIWHGANVTFFVWGTIYGVLLVMERAFTGKKPESGRFVFLKRLATFTMVTFLWVIFRADDISSALQFYGSMFSKGTGEYMILSFLSGRTVLAFVAAILCSGILNRLKPAESEGWNLVRNLFCLILLGLSLVFLMNGTYNPFIYFQF